MAVMLAANVAGVAFAGLAPFPELSAPRAVTQGPHDHFLANYFAISAWSPDNRHDVDFRHFGVDVRVDFRHKNCCVKRHG